MCLGAIFAKRKALCWCTDELFAPQCIGRVYQLQEPILASTKRRWERELVSGVKAGRSHVLVAEVSDGLQAGPQAFPVGGQTYVCSPSMSAWMLREELSHWGCDLLGVCPKGFI